jgi:DNA-binding NtrC family response regulator
VTDEQATLRLESSAEPEIPAPRARVTLVIVTREGKQEHVLERGASCTIGRADGCDVPVNDRSISRRHVKLSLANDGVVHVEDLGSANGTRVGQQKLGPGERGTLLPGDVLEIGSVFIVVDRVGLRDTDPPRPVATSSSMEVLQGLVTRVAKSNLSVLILGETGAGKEVLAARVHNLSPRAEKPFLKLNCAALAEQLLESELFGHERGAFTGAVQAKPGLLETADTGTIFLDEIGEMPLPLQAKLLRVLEDRQVLRVGALKPRTIDVRFVAATNRDLVAESAAGRFRQDLYFRLNGISLFLPPLRQRIAEIEPLALRFASGRTFTDRARRALESYPWPGNVRELKNVIERAVVLSDREVLDAEDLGLEAPKAPPAEAGLLKDDVDALEQRRILDVLAQCEGNQTKAAKMLGISRGTLITRMEKFGVARPRKK